MARKIEDSVATLQGVKNIYTKVLDGVVTVTVEFILEKQISEAVNDVRDAVARVKADLPAELRDPTVTKASTAGRVVLTFTAAAKPGAAAMPLDDQELSWFVDNTVAKRLLSVPGVGAVKRVGGVYREIRVELDDARMAALKVVGARRLAPAAPGAARSAGRTRRRQRRRAVGAHHRHRARRRPNWRAWTSRCRTGATCAWTRWPPCSDTVAEPRALAEQDGKRWSALKCSAPRAPAKWRSPRARATPSPNCRQRQPERGADSRSIDNAFPVEENFDGSMELLYEGALLAVLVVWWFLRDWRATLVAAAALPLSVMPAFLGIYWFGYTLNTVTLLSLALVVGVLVDDAIVEIENIARHLRMGKTPMQAAHGSGRRNRHGGHRHHLRAGGRVPADRLHGRHSRPVLQAVRLDRGAGDPGLAGGGAAAHADDGGLHPEAAAAQGRAGRLADARATCASCAGA